MIKSILTSLLLLIMIVPSNGQVWSENFNSGFPANWLLYNQDNKTPDFYAAFVNKAWVMRTKLLPAGGTVPGDSVIVSTSAYNPAGQSDDWVVTHQFNVTSPDMWLLWDARAYDTYDADGYEVRVSSTGSTPASFTAPPVYSIAAASMSYTRNGVSLSAFNGQAIRVAFRNNSNDKFFLGLDNIEARILYGTDVEIDSINFPDFPAAQTPVKVYIRNTGSQPVTALAANYKIDAGPAVSENFTGLNLAPFGTATLTFTTSYAGSAPGMHTLTIDIAQVNGTADQDMSNNQELKDFAVPSQKEGRAPLMEEFSASTCHPCAIINAWLDPFMETLHTNDGVSRVNAIKYQMDYPGSGDPSFNSHCLQRHNYYTVPSLPARFLNGRGDGAQDTAQLHQKINLSLADSAYFNISGSYVVRADSLVIDVSVKPYFTLNKDYIVHIAAVERHYQYLVDTPQQEYYHVLRKMFPNASGSLVGNWTDNTPQTYSFKEKYVVGNVVQNSFNFWHHPIESDLVVFIQDAKTKEVVHSKAIPAQWPAAIDNLKGGVSELTVYPNPAGDKAMLGFWLDRDRNMSIKIVDMLGRTMREIPVKLFRQGSQNIGIDVEGLSPGIYTILLKDREVQKNCKLIVK